MGMRWELGSVCNLGGKIVRLDDWGAVTCMYVACWNVCNLDQMFDWQSVLDLLIAWFSRIKSQIAAVRSWFVDFSSSEARLILWLLDSIFKVQTFLHRTYKWLPFDGVILSSKMYSGQRMPLVHATVVEFAVEPMQIPLQLRAVLADNASVFYGEM